MLLESDIKAFEPEAKVGILATVSPQGEPHLSLITSLRAKSPTKLMFGQFTAGRSKVHLRDNPRAGFAVMNAERRIWRGTAKWTGEATQGEDYILYNKQPMFRYNTYFGIHTVHYMDLVELTERTNLKLPALVSGTVIAAIRGQLQFERPSSPALKPWAEKHVANLDTLKFISYLDPKGYPRIIPVVPGTSVGSSRVVLVASVYRDELASIAAGSTVALFALNLKMESVLVRGTFGGLRRVAGLPVASIDIDWVYNSMPPVPGQVYPELPLQPVRAFS